MAKDGEVFPEPSDVSIIQESGDFSDTAAFAIIEIDVNRVSAETERVNITLPKWLISSIDASETNRSWFLAESAIKALQEKQRKGVA